MVGVESILRNLRTEDRENEREIQANQRAAHGENYQGKSDKPEDDAMHIMAAGDVSFNYDKKEETKEETPKAGIPSWLTPAIAAGLAALGGVGATAWWMQPAVQPTAPPGASVPELGADWGFGEPETVERR